MLRVVRALVLMCAVAAPAAAFGGERVVDVDVEGRVRRVTTYASAAPDVLRRAGHEPGARDEVTPKGTVPPGAVVRLRRAKPIDLVLDGDPRRVLVHGLTVGEALAELGMPPDSNDYVNPAPASALQQGMRVELRNAIPVTVRADGRTRDVVSSARTVGELLREARVTVGAKDRVVPAVDATPSPNARIRVVRVRERIVEERYRVPFAHREKLDPKLEKGLRRVAQRGSEGIKARRYSIALEDGKPVARTLVGEKLVRKPRDELVLVGTGQPVFRDGGSSQTGVASWFRADGLTAAHRSLPKGTVVRVTNLDSGRAVNVVVRDRGPFVDGRVIDLSSTAFQEIAPLGSGTARVRIEW